MNEALPTWLLPTWLTTPSVTSSLGSESGVTRCAVPGGPMIAESGPGVAPASLSALPVPIWALPTPVTSGPSGSGSSTSAVLTRSLASRLQASTLSLGSTMFQLTWRQRVTPSGRSISRLAASGRRTSGSGCTSWPTPRTPTGGPESAERKQELGRTESDGGDLQAVAQLAPWPTPTKQDQVSSGVRDYPATDTHHAGTTLTDAANLSSWATPTTRDHKDGDCSAQLEAGTVPINALLGRQAQLTASGPPPSGSPAATAKRGQLNPALSRWLMGLPKEWDDCGVTAMRSLPPRRKPSSKRT